MKKAAHGDVSRLEGRGIEVCFLETSLAGVVTRYTTTMWYVKYFFEKIGKKFGYFLYLCEIMINK